MSESASLRNVTHQHLHDYEQFVGSLPESWSGLGWRGTSDSLLEICVCGGVVELNSLDTAEIVVVAGVLGIGSRRREGGFRDQLVCLVVEGVVKV